MNRTITVIIGATRLRIKLDATAFVKWENRAKQEKKPLGKYLRGEDLKR